MRSAFDIHYSFLYDKESCWHVENLYSTDFEFYHTLRTSSKFHTATTRLRSFSSMSAFKINSNSIGINKANHTINSDPSPKIPRTLWIFWAQGWSNAPNLVQMCLKSWVKLNPNWTIHCLEDSTLGDFIDIPTDILKDKNIPKCALSDIIRINLLNKYGGVWTDATVLCNDKLDAWIDNVTEYGFFGFSKPAPTREIASWFLASAPGNYLTNRWHKKTMDLWTFQNFLETSRKHWPNWGKSDLYFWFHGLFNDLVADDLVAKYLWNYIPKHSADGPHFLQHNDLFGEITNTIKSHIHNRISPVYKLTHKINEHESPNNSILEYLNTITSSTKGTPYPYI
ncbi:capsular polysaccharide synthesis protein [Fundidesulfovibrio agrisoli]|uniref:capsular polysaccharide synthesis protein n=1 Tax=Fundidesulfovibrio agrisoli TaxID=2922717 RepID=UPI001FAC6AA6|nr:capsular polysaccharide synthesis protein [Fundidesulfovibrio agrisoli]